MNTNDKLLQRIQHLEDENWKLKNLLSSRLRPGTEIIPPDIGPEYYPYEIHTNKIEESPSEDNPPSATGKEFLFYENYISTLSRQLNSIIDEKGVLQTVLMELASRSSSRYLYYLQLDEITCVISSFQADTANPDSSLFAFQEKTAFKAELGINYSELTSTGFVVCVKDSSNNFFQNNKWLYEAVSSVIMLPVIVKNKLFGIIIMDITGKEKTITAVDIMIYQTVSSIVTGSLKRIEYENRIRDRKERYELIIENTSHLLFQTLPDGVVTFINRRFTEFFNIESSDIHGRPFTEILAGSARDSFKQLILRTLDKPESVQTELNLTDSEKKQRIIKLFINPVLSETGSLLLLNFLGEDITEKKLLENELLMTKRRLDLAFLASRDAYWDADLETGEFYYSQNFYKMLGYESGDMPTLFKDFYKMIHPDDRHIIRSNLQQCFDKSIFRATLRFRAKTFSGDYKWIFSRAMVIETDNSGGPQRIIGTNVDISAMVNIEERLKESETRLKLILDNMPVMLEAVNESGYFIHWNRECEHVTEYTREEIINNPKAGSLIYPEEDERRHFFNMLLEYGGNYRNLEVTLTGKSGLKKTVLWSNLSDLYPVPGWHSWAVGIDITPLKDATKALNESTYKLKEAQRIAKLGYWEYFHQEERFTWDGTLAQLLGFSSEAMTLSDKEMLSFIHGDDRRAAIKNFFECVNDRKIHNDVLRYITKNGDVIYVKQTSKTDYDIQGNPVISRGICLDITELKKTEIELVKARDKAEENNRLKSAFLANMSHEIRTPLNSIMGFSELLNDSEISPDEKIFYSEIIRDSSRQLTNLISDIIDISKIDANLMIINKQPLRLNRIMDHIFRIFKNEIKTRKRDISLEYFKNLADSMDIIVTDETRLQQILINLLANALKFTESGKIEFGYVPSADGRFIEFYVNDSGIGIPKNKQKMIFGRFKQADSSIARKYGGTGLGLSICRELCRLLGGKIWVRSEISKGSSFFFKIPYVPLSPGEFIDEKNDILKAELYTILKDKTILIVDDNKTVHRLLSAFFKKYGSSIIYADSGTGAVDAIKSNSDIDIVLLDIQMPDIDGTVVINMIKEINKNIPVIAQTANALEEDKKRYSELGFNAYVSKPYNREELIRTVSSLLIKS